MGRQRVPIAERCTHRLVELGELGDVPSPRVRCLLACFHAHVLLNWSTAYSHDEGVITYCLPSHRWCADPSPPSEAMAAVEKALEMVVVMMAEKATAAASMVVELM